jgi:hypothetical protein
MTPNYAGFGFVYKAHPPVHIMICAGGCNAVDGRKDKQSGVIIACLHPKVRGPFPNRKGASWRKPCDWIAGRVVS